MHCESEHFWKAETAAEPAAAAAAEEEAVGHTDKHRGTEREAC